MQAPTTDITNPAAEPQPRFLKPSEIADELRVGEWTVHGMIERGELPVLRVGSKRFPRIPRQAVEAWKARNLTGEQ